MSARTTAAQTPENCRADFQARAERVGPVVLQPLSCAVLLLLEETRHPFFTAPVGVSRLSFGDTARAIFIFAEPVAAFAALAKGPAEFQRQTMRLARCIDPALLPEIFAVIGRHFQRFLTALPAG